MKRFQGFLQGEEFSSEYDLPSDEVLDIQNRGVGPVRVIPIDISAAGTKSLNEVGHAFALYSQAVAGGALYVEAFCNVYVNSNDGSDPSRKFPAKCGRGFIGSFQKLFLDWPADTSGVYATYLVVYKSKQYPWTGGEEAQ